MPREVIVKNPHAMELSTVASKQAFSTRGRRSYGRKLTLLAAGESVKLPKGRRVEILLDYGNRIYFTRSSMTLSGPLVFWSKRSRMPGWKTRLKKADPVKTSCGVLAGIGSVVMMSGPWSNEPITIILLAVLLNTSFICLKSAMRIGKVYDKLKAPKADLLSSIHGVSLDCVYPHKPTFTNIE